MKIIGAVIYVAVLLTIAILPGVTLAATGPRVVGLTYTTPECSTTMRNGKPTPVYSMTVIWTNDGRPASDYVAKSGMCYAPGVINCTGTECTLPMAECYLTLSQWVRVAIRGYSAEQKNIAKPACPVG